MPVYFLGTLCLIWVVALHLDRLSFDLLAGVDTLEAEAETFLGGSIFIPEYLIHSLRVWVRYVESAGSLLDGIALLVDESDELPPLVIRQPPVLLCHILSPNDAKVNLRMLVLIIY